MSEVEKLVERLRNDFAPYWEREAKMCLTPEVARAYYERADQAREAAATLQSQARRVEELEGALEEARTQLRDALAVRNAALNAEAAAEADAIRYRYLREHHSSHYPMTWEQPAEWSIQWEFQQCTPDERFGSIDGWIDRDIASLDEEDRSALSEGSGSSRELAPPDESGDACGATERAEG